MFSLSEYSTENSAEFSIFEYSFLKTKQVQYGDFPGLLAVILPASFHYLNIQLLNVHFLNIHLFNVHWLNVHFLNVQLLNIH